VSSAIAALFSAKVVLGLKQSNPAVENGRAQKRGEHAQREP